MGHEKLLCLRDLRGALWLVNVLRVFIEMGSKQLFVEQQNKRHNIAITASTDVHGLSECYMLLIMSEIFHLNKI